MISLHTHTIWSDGDLLPSELARRAEEMGYRFLAFTDHVDYSNIDEVVPALVKVSACISRDSSIKVLPGVEITHVPPVEIPPLVVRARELGAAIVAVHGETLVEPVVPGTNRMALNCDIDILAHPGLLSEEDERCAAERSIHVEISSRKGHSLGNGRVVALWYRYGFPLVLNTDTHAPEDLITEEFARRLLIGAGVKEADVAGIFDTGYALAEKRYGHSLVRE